MHKEIPMGKLEGDLDAATAEIGTNVTAFKGDVGVLADVEKLLGLVHNEKGAYRCVVCKRR